MPLLLLQLWPQYRVIKLLITLIQDREDQQKYHAKKAQHDKNITCLGKSNTVFFCNEICSLSIQPKSNNRLIVYCIYMLSTFCVHHWFVSA